MKISLLCSYSWFLHCCAFKQMIPVFHTSYGYRNLASLPFYMASETKFPQRYNSKPRRKCKLWLTSIANQLNPPRNSFFMCSANDVDRKSDDSWKRQMTLWKERSVSCSPKTSTMVGVSIKFQAMTCSGWRQAIIICKEWRQNSAKISKNRKATGKEINTIFWSWNRTKVF